MTERSRNAVNYLDRKREQLDQWRTRLRRELAKGDETRVAPVQHRLSTAMVKLSKIERHAIPAWEGACGELEHALAELETAWSALVETRERSER